MAQTESATTAELSLELEAQETKTRGLWSDAFRRMVRNRLSMAGLFIFLLLVATAFFGPYLAPYPYMLQNLDRIAEGPSREYFLGTDDLGRDMLSRIMWGARTAGLVAIISTVFSLVLGMLLGAVAAYSGRWADWLIGRAIDVTMSIPQLLFASLIAATFRKPVADWVDSMYEATGLEFFATPTYVDLIVVFGALSLIQWPGYARLIRGQILSLREKEFVEAARAIGVSQKKILLKHLIPNALGPLIVLVTFSFGGAIVAESGLSFLGVGVQPPQASWGAMIQDNALSWRYRPWLVAVPGLTIAIVSVGINFLGDGLNDALNPRQAES
ncbi:MAG: ABC transporter permease [Caldilineaceae bacterium SB0670_bin_27]|uniref:Oligopeptide transport system permease protein OppC n=1 Tax=Caldilineaceae bacterium SB0664_bin_27 TaxID=2605260 RepID=A0A6B0YNT7_9CHLR|nr:ABC transporter permease [Caldilineaceae bacterium]MDE0336958.1 ABC transporter permease [Caldilineaceae bacterium]MXY92620.1 ABC transporter permease [Caldilineaceae bacterium SB0664_bin_27]MYJ77075.1 ABC transporter permease [Caldilineaceae bacterium SB0670_bin_27]